ncbi:lipoprotein-releasing system permease protein [Spirochaetota bacterium]|nr:lipoprotein-releasing system permease protein [Spirochaetota bacterium]
MKAQLLIAKKFLKPKGRKTSLTSLVSLLSVIGVMLGIMVPIVVISVMSGFQKEIKDKILSLNGHITMLPILANSINNYEEIISFIKKQDNVEAVTPYIEVQGLIYFQDRFEPVKIRGLDQSIFTEDNNFSELLEITQGQKDLTRKYHIMIGTELASNNYLSIDDRLNLVIADRGTLSLETQTKNVRGVIKGIFKTGFQDFDNNVVYVSLITLQELLNQPDRVNAIDIKLTNVFNTAGIVTSLITNFGDVYQVFTWKELNHNFFKALALEQTVMYLIMFFILVVAIFNVTSGQLMLIIERKREIGILKTLGMTPSHITQVFLVEGLAVTILGALIGGAVGFIISLNVSFFIAIIEYIINIFNRLYFLLGSMLGLINKSYEAFSIFPEGIYYLDKIPSDPSFTRVLFFITMAIILSIVSGLFPALKAAAMRPVDVMRYEQ